MDGKDPSDRLHARDVSCSRRAHDRTTLLRVVACGSAGDGTSTLIRSLLRSGTLGPKDQLAGRSGNNPDFARLVSVEHEQSTSSVLTTTRRQLVIADIPSDEQHTRNMLASASAADVALIVVDARKGVRTQTKRLSYLAHSLGVRHIVLAVNKLDLSGWDEAAFDATVDDYAIFANSLGIEDFTAIPLSALHGDNVASETANSPWYDGPCLLSHLESIELEPFSRADRPVSMADQFQATLVWMDDSPLLPGRPYSMKLGDQTVTATVHSPKYQVNVNNMAHLAARTLERNAIGVVTLSTDKLITFEPYDTDKTLGGFTLIDKMTKATLAAGMLQFALRRADNIHWQALEITREHHAAIKQQKPAVLWLTGLSGAGKSTVGNMVSKKLAALGRHTFLLDGDNIRHGLNRDLGFTDADRVENIRRVAEVVKLMTDAGLIVITAFISPFRAERQMVRQLMAEGEFFEIFIDTPLAQAEARDVKGLYKKARSGQLKNFTGIDSPYERPEQPELRIDTTNMSLEAATDAIVALLPTVVCTDKP